MTRYFGYAGTEVQELDQSSNNDYQPMPLRIIRNGEEVELLPIEMCSPRPADFYVAAEDGRWVYSAALAAQHIKALRNEAVIAEAMPLKNEAETEAIMTDSEADYTLFKQKVAEINQRYPLPIEV